MPQPYTYGQITKGVDIDTPTITIHGVTEDNYLDLCKVNGIQPIVNAAGEIIGWQYTQSESELTDEGYIERIYKVQMSAKKNTESTPSNVIIDFVPTSEATTSTRYKGSIQVNVNRDDYAKAVLKSAGVNLDLATVPDSVMDEMWQRYMELAPGDAYMAEDPIEGLEADWDWIYNIFSGSVHSMYQFLRGDTVDGVYKAMDSVDNLAAILSVAASMGMFSADDIFSDDPTTKAAMMQAVAGDHIQFKMPTDENSDPMDTGDSWLQAFLRPMMFAALVSGVQQLPTAQDFENYVELGTTRPVYELISDNMYDAYGTRPNLWMTRIDIGGQQNIYLSGLYDENEQYEIYQNYPAYGYAYINININENRVAPYYRQYNRGWYGAGYGTPVPSRVLFIYSFADFYAYFESLTTQEQTNLMNGYLQIFANCTYIPGQKDYITYDPDYIHLTPDMTPEDIIDILPTERPDWWDDRDTETNVDPKNPDTPKQVVYLPVGTGTNTPTDGTPAPQLITDGYPLTIPSITVPVNSIPEAAAQMNPTAGSSKFWTIYNPSDAEMNSLGGELWQQNVIQTLKQTFVNPTDGIISWHQIFIDPSDRGTHFDISSNSYNIMLGDYQTGVTSKIVEDNTAIIQCGILDVPTYYGDYRDITETEVSCYLPYIGFVDLDPRDVIGCKLTLTYRIDLLTGTCVANISPSKGGPDDRNVSECAYMFTGNCAVQLPITAADRSRLFSGMINGAMAGFATGAKLGGGYGGIAGAVAGGVIGGVAGYHGGVVKCNGLNANAGALSIYRTPYLIVQRNKPADPAGAEYHYGAPASKLTVLNQIHGFTRVREAYINIPRATDAEKALIESMLKQGIVLP